MPSRVTLFILAFIIAACRESREGYSSADSSAESALVIVYQCKSGNTVQASYPTDSTAVVDYEGQTRQMTLAVSASGARYVGGGLEWWTKGEWKGFEGTLFRNETDGDSTEIVEQCEQITDPGMKQ